MDKWTINRLADETGMDRRTVKKILTEGDAAPCDTDGKSDFYTLADFVSALIKYHKPKGSGLALEKELKARADRKTAEREYEILDRQYFPRMAVREAWENTVATIRQRILNIPNKLESQFYSGMTGAEVRHKAQEAVNEVLTECAKPISYDVEPDSDNKSG